MSWRHVEDAESREGAMHAWTAEYAWDKLSPKRELSTSTIALSTWRCGNCRALAVTRKGERPHCKCGKCGAPP